MSGENVNANAAHASNFFMSSIIGDTPAIPQAETQPAPQKKRSRPERAAARQNEQNLHQQLYILV